MKIINNIIDCYKHIPYTWKHYLAFLKVEKQLLGYYKYKFHDWDKLFMYIFLPFLGVRRIGQIHQRYRDHHPIYTEGKEKIKQYKTSGIVNWEEAIIDLECARLTKPDKPLNARDTLEKYYPMYKDVAIVFIEKLGL